MRLFLCPAQRSDIHVVSFAFLTLGQFLYGRSIAVHNGDGIVVGRVRNCRPINNGFKFLIFAIRINVEAAEQIQEDGHIHHEEDGQRSMQFTVQVHN